MSDAFAPGAARQLTEPEVMDSAEVDVRRLRKALGFIRRINFVLAYNRLLGATLRKLIKDLPNDRPLRVLDVATGSGDALATIQRFGSRGGRAVEIVALDLHAATLAEAKRHTRGQFPLVRGDALQLPFADGAFDIAVTSMFLHHLPTSIAADALRELDRVAAHGVIAADLLRDRWAYRWITLLTLFSDRMVRHDARISVKQAFSLAEAEQLRLAAGLDYATVRAHSNCRFILSGRKLGSASP